MRTCDNAIVNDNDNRKINFERVFQNKQLFCMNIREKTNLQDKRDYFRGKRKN